EHTRQTDTQEMLAEYHEALKALYQNTRTDSAALALVAAGYGDGTETAAKPVGNGLQALSALKAVMDADYAMHDQFWRLVEGPLAWQTVLAVQRSACELNEIWDSTVLAKCEALTPEALWEQLFGEQSVLQTFVEGAGKPFLRASAGGWRAARWLG
ncbi:MAG: hypothetical protein Q4F27_01320, partial [Desulfovibrionaceae bacterium]|nr:hypothetical protein [Desulfovibrionaceae bacterium]